MGGMGLAGHHYKCMKPCPIKPLTVERRQKIKNVVIKIFSEADKQELAYTASWLLAFFGMHYRAQGKEESGKIFTEAADLLDALEHCTEAPNGRTPDRKG